MKKPPAVGAAALGRGADGRDGGESDNNGD
jgi:hypothetical protein